MCCVHVRRTFLGSVQRLAYSLRRFLMKRECEGPMPEASKQKRADTIRLNIGDGLSCLFYCFLPLPWIDCKSQGRKRNS